MEEIKEELIQLYKSGSKIFKYSKPFKLQNLSVNKQQEYYYISYYFKPNIHSFFPKNLVLALKNLDEIRREENYLKFTFVIEQEELKRQIATIKSFIQFIEKLEEVEIECEG